MRQFSLPALLSALLLVGCVTPPPEPGPEIAMGQPILLPVRTPTYALPAPPAEKIVKHRKPPKPVAASKVAAIRPAPGSLFARLHLGMSRREVESAIGLPGDVKTTRVPAPKNASGPADLPVLAEETFYRQEGSLYFGKGGSVLTHINVNNGASGIQ